VITNAISRRYARALVQLSAEEGRVEAVHGELSRIDAALSGAPELVEVLTNPGFGIEAKREILKGVIEKLALSPTVSNFLLLLLDRGRLGYLSQIVASYGVLADDISGVVRPELISALPLEEAQVEAIKASLTKSTGKKIVLSVSVDPSLIGGVVTKIGDKVYDGSVRTQLSRIEDILQKG
jgi:F-type H+-transporting ATPase subunit delta